MTTATLPHTDSALLGHFCLHSYVLATSDQVTFRPSKRDSRLHFPSLFSGLSHYKGQSPSLPWVSLSTFPPRLPGHFTPPLSGLNQSLQSIPSFYLDSRRSLLILFTNF